MADIYTKSEYDILYHKKFLLIKKYNLCTNKLMRIYYGLRIDYIKSKMLKIDRSIPRSTAGGGMYNPKININA